MSIFNKLLKNTAWFFGSSISGRVLAFGLIPLYTGYLSPSDYGVVAICLMISDVIASFCSLELEGYCVRVLIKHFNDKEHLSVLLGNLYLFCLVFMFSCVLVLSSFTEPFYNLFFTEYETLTPALLLIPIWLAFCKRISVFFQDYLQMMQIGKGFFVITTVKSFLLHSLKILALVYFKCGLTGFLLAELITEGLIAVTSVVFLIRMAKPKIDFKHKKVIKTGIAYSVPMIPHNLSFWVLRYIDRIIILKFLDLWSVGLYAFVMNFASAIFNFLFSPFRQGIGPEVQKRMDHPDLYPHGHKHIIEYVYALILLTTQVGFVVAVFGQEIFVLMANERYHSAYYLLPLIVLHFISQNVKETFSIAIRLKYKTVFFPLNTLFCGTLNAIGNYLLIPIYGIGGAAISTVLSSFVMMLTTIVYSQKLIFIEYKIMVALIPLFTAIVLYLSTNWIDFSFTINIFLKMSVMICSVAFSFFYLKFSCPVIWEQVRKQVNNYLGVIYCDKLFETNQKKTE